MYSGTSTVTPFSSSSSLFPPSFSRFLLLLFLLLSVQGRREVFCEEGCVSNLSLLKAQKLFMRPSPAGASAVYCVLRTALCPAQCTAYCAYCAALQSFFILLFLMILLLLCSCWRGTQYTAYCVLRCALPHWTACCAYCASCCCSC